MKLWQIASLMLMAMLLAVSCGDDDEKDSGICDLQNPDCEDGQVCAPVQNSDPHCFLPVMVRGTVLDASDESGVADALVQVMDVNSAPVGTSVQTDSDGVFSLAIPAVRKPDGTPVALSVSLRVQAAGYQNFPTALRPAIPFDAHSALAGDDGWVVQSAVTTVMLLPIPGDITTRGAITGSINAPVCAGVLVVAEAGSTAYSGLSNGDCDYTIFNVPAGAWTVRGYAAGVQLDPASATVTAGEVTDGVDLGAADRSLSTVSGKVQIVNAPGDAVTSVVLAVESTFVEDAARGTVPPGLRVADIGTDFTIKDVPDGRYVILAAFENDDLVRDPDQTIGGTNIVHIEVPDPTSGNTVTLEEGFKVTEALAVTSPGADGPEMIATATPVFTWADDSSEDGYEVRVFDAFGTEIWQTEIGPVSGEETVSLTYGGPALEEGMYYQFKALSFREKTGQRTAISSTEDLKGVFYFHSGE